MSSGDIVFEIITVLLVTLLGIACLYPVMYIFSVSISNPQRYIQGEVWLFPKGFSLGAYKQVLRQPMIWQYYYNTVWYTVVGTVFNLIATVLLAYPLSKSYFVIRKPLNIFVVFTMFFSGGLIPTFLLVDKLGLYGTRWVMVTLGLVGTYYMLMCRTFFQTTLPEDLFASARIDGANEFRILWQIVVPLSKPILAVLMLYYGVGHWNTYLTALIYLPNLDMHPIQTLLRRVVIDNAPDIMDTVQVDPDSTVISNQVKYAVVFFAMLPVMCLYPFLQKYFMKGVMVGALKG